MLFLIDAKGRRLETPLLSTWFGCGGGSTSEEGGGEDWQRMMDCLTDLVSLWFCVRCRCLSVQECNHCCYNISRCYLSTCTHISHLRLYVHLTVFASNSFLVRVLRLCLCVPVCARLCTCVEEIILARTHLSSGGINVCVVQMVVNENLVHTLLPLPQGDWIIYRLSQMDVWGNRSEKDWKNEWVYYRAR